MTVRDAPPCDARSSSGRRKCRRRAIYQALICTDMGFWLRAWVCGKHAP